MDQSDQRRRYLSMGNRIVVNREFIGLGHTLEAKKKERKDVEQQEKEMRNKVTKLEQEENKAMKDVEKKYEQLQNIYKIRMRKQQEQDHKDKLKRDKEEEIRILKLQWREERERNTAKKKASMDGMLEANRRAYFTQKNSRHSEQMQRHQTNKKTLQKNINKTIEVRHDKESGIHKIIEFKRTKNKESIEQYKVKLHHEEEKKRQKIEKLKSLSLQMSEKELELEKNLNAKNDIEEIIKKAHEIGLSELEGLMVAKRPVYPVPAEATKAHKKRMVTKSGSKTTSRRVSQESLYKTAMADASKEEEDEEEEKPERLVAANRQEIEDTIKIIERLEAEQSTFAAGKHRTLKTEEKNKTINPEEVNA